MAGSILIAACSGGGDDVSDRSTSPASITVPVDSTDATTTTTTTSSTMTTSPAPTTTDDPTAALIAEIEADLNAGEQALIAAGGAPDDPTLRDELGRYFADPLLRTLMSGLDELVADGLLLRANDEVESVVVVLSIESHDVDSEPVRATVRACRVDATIVYMPLDGQETIVNDAISSVVAVSDVSLVDGVWRLSGGEQVEDRGDARSCDGL